MLHSPDNFIGMKNSFGMSVMSVPSPLPRGMTADTWTTVT